MKDLFLIDRDVADQVVRSDFDLVRQTNAKKVLSYMIGKHNVNLKKYGRACCNTKLSHIAKMCKLSYDQVRLAIKKIAKYLEKVERNPNDKRELIFFLNVELFSTTSIPQISHEHPTIIPRFNAVNSYNNDSYRGSYSTSSTNSTLSRTTTTASEKDEMDVVVISESVLERTDKSGFERGIIFGMVKRFGVSKVLYALRGILHQIEREKIVPKEVNRFFIASLRKNYIFDQYEKCIDKERQRKARERRDRERIEKEECEERLRRLEYEKKERLFTRLSQESQNKLIQKTKDEIFGSDRLTDRTIRCLAIEKLPDDNVGGEYLESTLQEDQKISKMVEIM